MRKLFLLLVMASPLWAQMTLHECVKIALTHNPGLKIVEAEATIAREDQRQAGAAMLPSLDFSGSYRRQSTVPELRIDPIELPFGGSFTPFPGGGMQLGVYDNYDFRLTVSQPLFAGFRLRNRKSAAEAFTESKTLDVSRNRSDLIFKVESAYAAVLKAQKFCAIAQSAKDQVAAHLHDGQVIVEQGLARKDELLKVQVKLSEAELGLVRAENAIQLARAALENLLGQNLPTATELAVSSGSTTEIVDIESSLQKALAQRPEFKGLASATRATQTGKKIVQGAWLPSLGAFATFGYGKPGLDFINKDWMDYWLVGVGAEWNLWNWGKTGSQVQQAELRIQAIHETGRQLRDAIVLDVTQACLQADEAQKRCAVAAEMEKQAQESFRVTERQYQQGQVSHTDFFDAQSEWTRAQLHKAEAEVEATLAQANWRRAVGVSEKEYK